MLQSEGSKGGKKKKTQEFQKRCQKHDQGQFALNLLIGWRFWGTKEGFPCLRKQHGGQFLMVFVGNNIFILSKEFPISL